MRVVHGMWGHPVRDIWAGILDRCYNPKNGAYKYYGEKGIFVCSGLKETPRNLLSLLGERPKGRSIDRRNNDGGYTCGQCADCMKNGWPQNVRWATPVEQQRNRSNTIKTEFNGSIRPLGEIADISGTPYYLVLMRYKHGVRGLGLVAKSQKQFVPLVGKKFGHLTVISEFVKNKIRHCKCLCDCGAASSVRRSNLVTGNTKTCRRWCDFGTFRTVGRKRTGFQIRPFKRFPKIK